MLQQTRVEAVLPYYRRFLELFPTIHELAAASEDQVLAAWSGLGYYSRARNLHRASRQITTVGLPATHAEVRALPGAGPYTAAAIASIALGLPCAAVDGNVIRVISRLTNDPSEITSPQARRRFNAVAETLLDPARPGDFNQAMMELGATVCTPRNPACSACPVDRFCDARIAGRELQLPVRMGKPPVREVATDLVLATRGSRVLLLRRASSERRLAGFWELPDKRLFRETKAPILARFSHHIVNDRFLVTVWGLNSSDLPDVTEGRWFEIEDLEQIPLTTLARKAIRAAAARKLSAGAG